MTAPARGAIPVRSQAPVGRDRELAELDELAARVRAGGVRPAGLVVSGDAGIGKTTVLGTFADRLASAGWLVGIGHCVNLGGNPLPYLPFVEVFDRLGSRHPERTAAVVGERPALARLLAHGAEDAAGDGTRIDLLEAVRTGLEQLCPEAGLLVWIEDVHWADQSTLDLISYLLTRTFAAPVLLAVSYRTDDLHRRHPLRPMLAQWSRLPVVRLELRPLAPEALTALVAALDGAPSDPDVVRDVVARAEGNAFFAEELASAAGSSSAALPLDLSELLLFRLNALSEDTRAVVRAASVAGRRAPHELLAAVVGMPEERLAAALREAVDAQVLRTEDDAFVFRHALLAEAVSTDLLPGERVRLHAAFLRVIRQSGLGTASDLARHALAAGDEATALSASVKAGHEAMAVGGPDEALAHFETALTLFDRRRLAADRQAADPQANSPAGSLEQPAGPAVPADPAEVDVVVQAAAAAAAAGLPQRALALARDGLGRLAPTGGPLVSARLLEAAAAAALWTEVEDPVGFAAEAVELLPDEPTELRARVLRTYANALANRGRQAESLRWADEAHQLATRLELLSLAAETATLIARLRGRSGEVDVALQTLQSVIVDARSRNDPTELRARYLVAMIKYEDGDLTGALEDFRAAADRATRLGRPWAPYGVDAKAMFALTLYALGRWEEGLQVADTRGQSAPPIAAAMLRATAVAVLAGRGDPRAVVEERAVRHRWIDDGMIAAVAAPGGIDAHGDAEDLDAAIALHAEIVDFLTEAWRDPDFPAQTRIGALLIGQLASAAARPRRGATSGGVEDLLERGDRAAEAGERAFRVGRQRRHTGIESDAWLARLRAEASRLRWLAGVDPPGEKLIDAWRRSVAEFDRYGHRFERARSQARLAAALRAVGRRDEARELAATARVTAKELGAVPLLAEIDDLRLSSENRHGGLTPREVEVLQLVAEGLSNAEVGRSLFISTKTASVHVSNILAKLAVDGRTEAVAVARRRSLI